MPRINGTAGRGQDANGYAMDRPIGLPALEIDMLMVVSQSLGKSGALVDVARQLSLAMNIFSSVQALDRLMSGRSRRIVVLAEADVTNEVADALVRAKRHAEFGLLVLARTDALRASDRARAAKTLAACPTVEWLDTDADPDALGVALRKCRRRMLKLGKGELEKALLKRELFLQYQPKVERTEGSQWKTREAEALIRWRHPVHGLLGPLEFLPEAEAFELIGPISEFVLFEVAGQLVRWQEKGLKLNACINLASSQLNNPDLAAACQRLVDRHQLEYSRFTFEVAEQDIANSKAPHLMVLNEMRRLGFRISLDDFGVAASSLAAFERLPFDEIKIHATALERARGSETAQKVLAAITGLAHNLGMCVCAEGVEDRETFEFLKTIECDKMQGYLISEAVMPDIIRRVYRDESDISINVA